MWFVSCYVAVGRHCYDCFSAFKTAGGSNLSVAKYFITKEFLARECLRRRFSLSSACTLRYACAVTNGTLSSVPLNHSEILIN